MQDDDVKINVTFAVDFYINPMKQHLKPLARLILSSSSTVIPEIIRNKFSGNLTETTDDIREDFSDIGEIPETFLNLFKKLFTMTSRVIVESILHKGVPIPVFDNDNLPNTLNDAEKKEFKNLEHRIADKLEKDEILLDHRFSTIAP
ncbi:unnamed protein product [Cylicocyclus nassatus]|uniref:Uncharacterized protein n=1 Tax=Cylicocyclus nassatus TaxID=53992 RepID=A0AA36GSI5_CYLNA|nr:unnamed protein product [Cylicocyclus nassatus]